MERFTISKHGRDGENIKVECPGGVSPKSLYIKKLLTTINDMDGSQIGQLKPKPISDRISMATLINRLATKGNQSANVYPTAPERILDAPQVVDDFYLRLIDWGKNDILAVALSESVYLWNGKSGQVNKLMSLKHGYISSLRWIQSNGYTVIAIGTSDGAIQLWDIEKSRRLRLIGHDVVDSNDIRVGSLDWNTYILSSGSKTGSIYHTDVRIGKNYIIKNEGAHSQEVCGLTWSEDGSQLASGGNDNKVNIWDDIRAKYPDNSLVEHTAAVKALAWCPWKSRLLATGGGRADQSLKIWNTVNGECKSTINTGAQITDIVWTETDDSIQDLITSHGYSENLIQIWNGNTFTRKTAITGKYGRVLTMAISPNRRRIATLNSEENIKFWNIYSTQKNHANKNNSNTSDLSIQSPNVQQCERYLCSPLKSPYKKFIDDNRFHSPLDYSYDLI